MEPNKIIKGSDALVQRLVSAMSVDGQIHAESVISAMGCLAGYACQADVRSEFIVSGAASENDVFDIFSDKNGKHYYFGELTDKLLIGDGYSLLAMLGMLKTAMPDIEEIMRFVSSNAGSESFGKVRSCAVGEDMCSYLKNLWQPMCALAIPYCEKSELHIVFGAALTKLILTLSKQGVDTKEAVRIAMESAVSMSRVDIGEI